ATFNDKSIRILDTQSPFEEKEYLTNEKIGCVNFSPDGQKLIAGVEGNKLRIMDWPDLYTVRFLEVPGTSSCPFTISADGATVATSNSTTVHLWDVQSKSLLGTATDELLSSFAIAPDGQTLATRNTGFVKLWQVLQVQEQKTLNTSDWVAQVTFSSSGETLITRSQDQLVEFWNPQTLQKLPGLSGSPEGVAAMSVSRDGLM